MAHYFTDNSNLRSEMRTITYENKGDVFTFFSDLGVFSKDKIDYGSRLLVETILKKEIKANTILDVGCGYGFMGIVLSKKMGASIDMIDVNARAVHLAEKNIKENKIEGRAFLSDAYQEIKDSYDVIVTNPPIRAGKETVLRILRDAKLHLNKNGSLWFVIRKDQGAKSIMKNISDIYNLNIEEKSKGFYIILATVK